MTSLINSDCVEQHHHNVIAIGSTDVSKNYLACSLTRSAIVRGCSALYVRVSRLLGELAVAEGDGRIAQILNPLSHFNMAAPTTMLLVTDPPRQGEDKAMGLEGFQNLFGVGMELLEGSAWYQLPNTVTKFSTGSGSHPAILRKWVAGSASPNSVVFCRTTSKSMSAAKSQSDFPHQRHDHVIEFPKCTIDDDGRIVMAVPCSVPRQELEQLDRRCIEEDQATIDAVKAAQW